MNAIEIMCNCFEHIVVRVYVRLVITFLVLFQSTRLLAWQDTPLVLNAHSMVYHEAEGRTYIFGGATESGINNDLRIVENGVIRTLNTSGNPEARTFAAIGYDPQDKSILLFGGSRVLFGNGPDPSNLLNDTWKLDDGQWTRLSPQKAPEPRAEAAMTYDLKRERFVLFGGYKIENGTYVKLNDTWEFYDDQWHKLAETGPSARSGAALSFDPRIRKTILFGGSSADRLYGPNTGETWVWEGKWTKLKIDQPANVFNSNMAYNPYGRQMIRFGGWQGNERINESWEFNMSDWVLIKHQDPKPAARNHSQMIYDYANRQFVLFGGHNGEFVFGDLWVLSKGKWTQVIETAPLKRLANQH